MRKHKTHFHKLLNRFLFCTDFPKYNKFLFCKQYINNDHKIDRKLLSHYLTYLDFINGWFHKEEAQMFLWLDYIQKKENVSGNLFEIGTFEGKSSLMLALMTNPENEKLGLCDLFGGMDWDPEWGNINRAVIVDHLKSFFNDMNFIKIYEKRSNELTENECNNCRFVHVDGGHSEEDTLSDLKLASKSIIQKGLVVIDDLYLQNLPSVTDGIYKFLTNENSLVPVAMFAKKLLLCKPGAYDFYMKNLKLLEWKKYITTPGLTTVERKLLGKPVLVFGVKFFDEIKDVTLRVH